MWVHPCAHSQRQPQRAAKLDAAWCERDLGPSLMARPAPNKDVPAPPLDCVKSSLSLVDLYEKDFLEKKRLAGDGGAPAAAGTGEEGAPLTWQQQVRPPSPRTERVLGSTHNYY